MKISRELINTPHLDCPPRAVWREFSHGLIAERYLKDLGTHLESCSGCFKLVQKLCNDSDSMVDLITQQSAHFSAEPECQQLMHTLTSVSASNLSQWQIPETSSTPALLRPAGIPNPLGDYELRSQIGRGAMSQVFRARHRRLGREVVVKVLAPRDGLCDDLIERFSREHQAVGSIQHRNVVAATDARETDGIHYLVMEYHAGLDVGRISDRLGPLRLADACEIVRQAAIGLAAAHEVNLVHRDVKPSNLLLTDDGIVKVLDLGLVALKNQSGGATGARRDAVGTPNYMAPEQWRGEHVGPGTDIYGLGCTLFKLFVGQGPFEADMVTGRQLREAHCHHPVPTEKLRAQKLPEVLVDLVSQMLSKRVDKRPRHASDVATALKPYSANADLKPVIANAERFSIRDTQRVVAEPTVPIASAGKGRASSGNVAAGMVLGLLAIIAVVVGISYASRQGVNLSDSLAASIDSRQVRPPDYVPIWSAALRQPVIRQIDAGGQESGIAMTANGQTLLDVGMANAKEYSLTTSFSLAGKMPDEAAGMFLGGAFLEEDGFECCIIEVAQAPLEQQQRANAIGYDVRCLYLFDGPDKPTRRRAISRNVEWKRFWINGPASPQTLAVRVSPTMIYVSWSGRLLKIARSRIRTSQDQMISTLQGQYGFYLKRGEQAFSHITYAPHQVGDEYEFDD